MAEVLIEGRRLDVMQELDFSFNYSIADVRDPSKRSTSFSKTIQCPSNPNNDLLFGQIYDVNISNPYDSTQTNIGVNFNPNKKAKAVVTSDGVEVMSGVVQLRKVKMRSNNYIYEVVFIGRLINIFSTLADKQLNGVEQVWNEATEEFESVRYIDFSDLDHVYSRDNIVASWYGSTEYVYPMIDYGDSLAYENGERVYSVRDFRPAVYLKTIIDRIFSFAGFTYTSAFFDSSFFAKLIIPFNKDAMWADESELNTRKFQAEQTVIDGPVTSAWTALTGETGWRTVKLDDDSTSPNFDAGNNWNSSTWVYLVPNAGIYSFAVSQTIRLERVNFNLSRQYQGYIKFHLQIIKVDLSLVVTVIADMSAKFDLTTTINPTYFDESINLGTTADDVLLFAGERIFFRYVINNNELTTTNNSGQLIANSYMWNDWEVTSTTATGKNDTEGSIFEGDLVFMNQTVVDVGMADLIMSVAMMFNLYLLPNPDDEKDIIIKTRDDFYSGGVTRDWTKKMDRSSSIDIEPMGLLADREYLYTYKEDGDYYNERYQNRHGHTYGRRRIEVDNDFVTNTKEVDVVFSASPLVNDGNSARIITKIYDSDISEGVTPTGSNIRVLYYNRILTTGTPDWTFSSYFSGTGSVFFYPYAGHLTHPLAPAQDINFGIPQELYYTANVWTGTLLYTNNNLYNRFHKRHIEEITNKDAKVLTAFFDLTAWDIEKLDFRDQILIDNSYWRMNRVMDYNPFKEGLTKVELIKIVEVEALEAETFTVGTSGTVGSGTTTIERKPIRFKKLLSNLNEYPGIQGTVKGERNIIQDSAFSFKVLGDDNFIGQGSKRITIIGSDNYVSAGISDVTIINSDGFEIYESNITIIDGKRQWVHVDKDDDYTAMDREFVLCDCTSKVVTITLPPVADSTDVRIQVLKTDVSASGVVVDGDGSETINGATTYNLGSQYDFVSVWCDGVEWFITE